MSDEAKPWWQPGPHDAAVTHRADGRVLVWWRGKLVGARASGRPAYGFVCVVGLPGTTGAVSVPTVDVRWL